MSKAPLALVLLALAASPGHAFHRQTPPAVRLTSTGDNDLPRLPAFGNKLVIALASGGGTNLFRFVHGTHGGLLPLTSGPGRNEHPAANAGGSVVVWDVDCGFSPCAESGHQIFVIEKNRGAQQVTHDPTGTSENPAVNGRGNKIAFESQGDLAGGNNGGSRQIFVLARGLLIQVSRGAGDSRNPALSRTGRLLAFDSTSDPVTQADTGVSQIWLAPEGETPAPITAGGGSSRMAAVAGDGKLIAFESTADLAGNGADTGVPQIYAYELRTGIYHRLTDRVGGCTGPTVDDVPRDWRVAFTCGGKAYVHRVRANERVALPDLDAGDTRQIAAELGAHFVVAATTANPYGGAPTAGHQLYLLNLFKLPVVDVASEAIQY